MNQLEEIWRRYHSKLLSFIRSRVPEKAVSEDILQDIFIKIYSKIDSIKDETKIESWLFQIARNTIIDYYRSHQSLDDLPEWLEQPEISQDEKLRQELSLCLEPMIKQLPEKYRHAVYLSEIVGKKQKEIALEQTISLSAAKSRVQRGRTLLKTMLHDCCEIEVNKKNQILNYQHSENSCEAC